MNHLNTQEKCIEYLEYKRWQGIPVCPYCESKKSSSKSLRHTCLECNNSYRVTVGTVFQDSNIPLTKWFMGIALILSAKKGISSLQLSRDLSVNKNTAWLLQMKIRNVMKEDSNGLLEGVVEADETFIGGKVNSHYPQRKKRSKPVTGTNHLKPVLGMVERNGKVIAQVIKTPLREDIMPILQANITPSSTVVTDGSSAYFPSKKYFKDHQILSKSSQCFKRGEFHTNTIEGFWSLLKRAIIGQYHRVNELYLQMYIDELSFKYNYRNNTDRGFSFLMGKLIGASVAKC